MLGKLGAIATIFLLVFVMSANPALSEPYNISVNTDNIYFTQYCVGWPVYSLTTPIDPKIACDTDGSNCIALVYDTCFGDGVRVLWSVDKFQTYPAQVVTTIPVSYGSNFLDYYVQNGQELPYDVEYFDDYHVFYIVANNQIYAAFTSTVSGPSPPSPLPHVYTPSSSYTNAGGTVFGSTININCATILTTPKNWAGLGYSCLEQSDYAYKFEDGNATNLWGIELCQPYDGSDWDGVLCEWNYDVTNTTYPNTKTNLATLDYTVSCSAGGNFGIDNISATAFYTGSDWKYDVEGQVDYCTNTVDDPVSADSLSSPQDDFLQTYFGGNLYWRNVTNVTENISGYIYKASTTDFSSYGSTSLVYNEDFSINETINQSDATTAGDANLYIWERKTQGGSDEANNGIWVYRESNYHLFIITDQETPVGVNLYCNETGSDYYDSGSGDDFTLNTPCQDGNRLIITSGNKPSSYIDYIDIPSDCLTDGMYIYLKYAQTPYNHTFTVRTESNIPVPGANITVTGEGTNTTDSNGQALFELQTISGSTLERINTSTCQIDYSTDGAGVSKSYTIEKSGFLDVDGTIPAPINTPNSRFNNWTFITPTEETIYESGMFLDVNLKIGSNIEISPCNYEIEASGPDLIQVMVNDVPQTRTTYDEFPMEYKFNHSSSPVNVTLTLTLPNGSSIIEYHNLTYDERDSHTFYLPYSIENLRCGSSCDCPESICVGKYFYDGETSLCNTGYCNYTVSNCQLEELCDDDIGCFDVATTDSCTTDNDCSNSCIDDNTMVWGRCGADGLCKNVTYDCATECNTTAQICEELRLCEQGSSFTAKAYYFGHSSSPLLSGVSTCDVGKVDEYSCIPSDAITKAQLDSLGLTISDLYITPTDWTYTTSSDGLYYNFSSISVYCGDDCSIEYEVCGSGKDCDSDTGRCVAVAGGIESQVYNLLPTWLQWLLTTMVLWTFLSLALGAVLTFLPAKFSDHAQPTPQLGLASVFVMYIIGIGLGFVDAIIGLMILIGLGLALAKMISDMLSS